MKKAITLVLLVLVTFLTVGCASVRMNTTLFVGTVGKINYSDTTIEFASFVPDVETYNTIHKSDSIPDILDKDYYGYEGPWKYVNTAYSYGYHTKYIHYYQNEEKDPYKMIGLAIDDDGKCVYIGTLNVSIGDGIEIPEGAESVTEEEAIVIAENFAINMLKLSVEGYSVSCVPVFDAKGRLNYYEVNYDNGYHGEYDIKDGFSIFVDGYQGRCPNGIRLFSTRYYKWIDRERVPEINVEKMDALVNSKIFDEARKSTNNLFVDTNRLKMEISNREIIQSDEGKLYYECYVRIAKQSDNKDEDIWVDFYDTNCYIPLD